MLAPVQRDSEDPAPEAAPIEPTLVRRARDGDRAAFDRLVGLHLPRVWAVVARIVRNREDAEDVVQEAFLTAHRSIAEFRGDAAFSTWLHRIAVTRALNHLNRASVRLARASEPIDGDGVPELAAPEADTPLKALESKELLRRLADCLEKLPGAWKAVVALRDAEELPYDEIARILGIELGTVRSRLARARGSLKACVEGGSR
jgi:RNA polymerase sigma-70 factor (ECF subfamily)